MKTKIIAHFLSAALLFTAFTSTAQNAAPKAGADSVLQIVIGDVQVAAAGTAVWTPAQKDQPLKVGDRIKTGKNSKATVKLSNQSVLRVYELTTLEIQPPAASAQNPTLDLKSGTVYFFNREKPESTQFRTPSASGAIRGTEFNLAVAEDGRMLLTLVDGEVNVQNELGSLELKTGEQAMAEPGKAPQKTPSVDAINVIQWTLYYPGVVDVDELGLSEDLKVQMAPSLDAYRSGDLVKAMESYPWDRESASPEDKVYRAALSLTAGKVDQAQNLLQNLGEGRAPQIGEALKMLIAAVKNQEVAHSHSHSLATELMASSYYHQSRGELAEALEDARAAADKSPNFGFAHARVAEMEFSFANTDAAMAALDKALSLSPRNAQAIALKGFLLAAKNKMGEAEKAFDQAIEVDGNLGNAWLGRGLSKIKKGRVAEGRNDLQTAVGLEPNRAILRAYLGKAWSMGRPGMYSWDQTLATKELNMAKTLDPNDPTSWLYSALLNQQRNQVNDAIQNLEKSKDLNDNRRIFRSKLLLDQDRAVRGVNLASVYRDAGMIEYSVREASRAVENDPANFSAHQFLSDSYASLLDPRQFNARYETPWLSSLLVANLLKPVGGGNLSQSVSQQEYSKLFEADRFGVFTRTEYTTAGEWLQQASQFGTVGRSTYALDFEYRSLPGQRVNNDFESTYFSVKFKQEITEKDSVFLQVSAYEQENGYNGQVYDQNLDIKSALFDLTRIRTEDEQTPWVHVGYHRKWSPGNHTLFLFSRLSDDFDLVDPRNNPRIILSTNGSPAAFTFTPRPTATQTNHSEIVAYSLELQQILQLAKHTIVAGARYQTGDVDSESRFSAFGNIRYNGSFSADMERYAIYAYDYWQILDPLQLSAGFTYDHMQFPVNVDVPPLIGREATADQLAPKVGLRYTPFQDTTLRFAYTRSLGGSLFADQSVRLEPVQIAGFTQAYRSIAPESVVGTTPGTEFSTLGFGVEQRFATRTYLTLEAQILESEADRPVSTFNIPLTGGLLVPTPIEFNEHVEYEERSLAVTVNQLLADDWSIGLRYRWTDAELTDRIQLPAPLAEVNQDSQATLHQTDFFALYHHPCGFFAQTDVQWVQQSNKGFAGRPGDDFWQTHLFAGYRFPRRQAEIRVGLLNIFDQDYQLNPVNFYLDYPRERTLTLSFKFNY